MRAARVAARAAKAAGVGACGLAAGVGARMVYQALGTARDARRYPPPGEFIDVGGRRLHLLRGNGERGDEGPTVVLDAGIGQSALVWEPVRREVAKFTRVVAYDRAGYAWSDAGPALRGPDRLAGELRALLRAGGVPGPYVLVAHSMSGLTARLLAARHPGEVAGLVLVDAVHEGLWDEDPELFDRYFGSLARRFRSLAPVVRLGLLRLASGLAGSVLPAFVAAQPEETRPDFTAGYVSGKNLSAAAAEARALAWGAEQTRRALAAGPPPKVALEVLAHGVPSMFSGLPDGEARMAERAWQKTQARAAKIAPQGRLVVVEGASHDNHVERPAAVVEAIHRVVRPTHRAGQT